MSGNHKNQERIAWLKKKLPSNAILENAIEDAFWDGYNAGREDLREESKAVLGVRDTDEPKKEKLFP